MITKEDAIAFVKQLEDLEAEQKLKEDRGPLDLTRRIEELEAENYELSDLEDDDDDVDEYDARSFDIETCEFVHYNSGYYKVEDKPDIYNAEGDVIGQMVNGEYIEC